MRIKLTQNDVVGKFGGSPPDPKSIRGLFSKFRETSSLKDRAHGRRVSVTTPQNRQALEKLIENTAHGSLKFLAANLPVKCSEMSVHKMLKRKHCTNSIGIFNTRKKKTTSEFVQIRDESDDENTATENSPSEEGINVEDILQDTKVLFETTCELVKNIEMANILHEKIAAVKSLLQSYNSNDNNDFVSPSTEILEPIMTTESTPANIQKQSRSRRKRKKSATRPRKSKSNSEMITSATTVAVPIHEYARPVAPVVRPSTPVVSRPQLVPAAQGAGGTPTSAMRIILSSTATKRIAVPGTVITLPTVVTLRPRIPVNAANQIYRTNSVQLKNFTTSTAN